MQVRTKIGSLVASAFIAGALSIANEGNGTDQPAPSSHAVEVRSLPPTVTATFHTVGPNTQNVVNPEPRPPQQSDDKRLAALMPIGSFDSYALEALKGGLLYICIFILAHLGLRKLQRSGRWAYAGAGSIAALISIAGITPLKGWEHLLQVGMLSFYFVAIASVGAMIGFIYRWRAGLEAAGDEPNVLAGAVVDRAAGRFAATASSTVPMPHSDDALIATGSTEYFNGPLQVRTTFAVMFVAAVVSSGFYSLMMFAMSAAGEMGLKLDDAMPFARQLTGFAETKLMMTIGFGFTLSLCSSFWICLIHLVLKGLNQQSYPVYVGAGLLPPVLVGGLLAGPIGLFLGLQAGLPMAISMGVYRSMAGLEPKPVKEDIILNDRRNLVGADHARRQFGRVVGN